MAVENDFHRKYTAVSEEKKPKCRSALVSLNTRVLDG
jgi:hypothetical protein